MTFFTSLNVFENKAQLGIANYFSVVSKKITETFCLEGNIYLGG